MTYANNESKIPWGHVNALWRESMRLCPDWNHSAPISAFSECLAWHDDYTRLVAERCRELDLIDTVEGMGEPIQTIEGMRPPT
jgi:hypothetical protein